MSIRALAASTTTAATLLSGAAFANHIDFIVDGPFMVDDGGSIIVAGSSDNILGGQRLVAVDSVDAIAQLDPGDTAISFDALGTTEATLTLSYGDFAGGNPLNSDFASMWSAIAVDFTFVTGSVLLSVEVESSAGVGVSAQTLVATAGSYEFDFDQPAYNGVDFSDVDRVTVEFASQPGAAFALESITRVPGPATASTLGLLVFVGARRRR